MTKTDMTNDRTIGPVSGGGRSQFAFLAPVALFLGLAVLFTFGLTRNAREIPSVLIGKPVPEFTLPPVEGRTVWS